MTEAVDIASADLWLDQAIGHRVSGPLDKADALALTAKIKSYVGVTWVLIAAAHDHKAHKALGYATWGEYVEAEFDMSRSRSYQLISQAKVVLEISESVSTMVDISERTARDLEPVLDEAKAVAIEAAQAAAPQDKQTAVNEALDRMRESMVAAKRPQAPAKQTTTVVVDNSGGYAEVDADGVIQTSGEEEPSATGSGAGEDVAPDQTRSASSPVLDPTLRLIADFSRVRAEATKWLAFDRHEQVIAAMTAEQIADYRRFCLSVFNHASATIDRLDAPTRLKAVQ